MIQIQCDATKKSCPLSYEKSDFSELMFLLGYTKFFLNTLL